MIRLAIRVHREHAELVLAELLELAPSGVEEADVGEDLVEYAVYGPPGELPALPDLEAAARGALVQVTSTEVADDWAERWREFHRPLVLGDRLTVRPPWEPPGTNSIELVIDPGQAFGTGAHATTRLCLELLLDLADSGAPEERGAPTARGAPEARVAPGARGAPGEAAFLDLGCGSGVLAIAAARLGWAPVLALDNDPASVAATRENAAVNGVAIEVRRHDLRTDPTPPAGTVAANLLAPLLVQWAAKLAARPRQIIAGGLLVAESDRVAGAFAALGYETGERRERGGWAALLLSRGT